MGQWYEVVLLAATSLPVKYEFIVEIVADTVAEQYVMNDFSQKALLASRVYHV